MSNYTYFIRSLNKIGTKKICPYCKSNSNGIIDRKYIITTLNECYECGLYFRHPTDTVDFNKKFYQDDYEQNDGITTDLPSIEDLKVLMANNFKGNAKDYSYKIDLIRSLLNSASIKVIDYGANWGYTSFQIKNAGFQVQSYEISKPRANFGRNFGIEIQTDESALSGNVDVFFNSHVIEHLPDIKSMFVLAKKLLNKEGYLVCYCPNGSRPYQKRRPAEFHRLWGQVHPNYLNSNFFSKAFKDVPYLIGCEFSTKEEINMWDKQSQVILDTSGNELFVFAKIKGQVFN